MFLAIREIRRAKVRFGLLAGAVGLLVFLIVFLQALFAGLITSFVGAGGPRFWQTVTPELSQPHYAQLIVEMAVKKLSPTLFRQLGIFLPLITTNCAILGLAIFQTNRCYGLLEGLFFAVGAGLGLTLALVLMASIRETTELSDVPDVARGTGLVLIIAGTLSLAFMGFAGLLSTA